jgi:N-acyl-phosphatidylethanolamine-hydrolysing phospholipase D
MFRLRRQFRWLIFCVTGLLLVSCTNFSTYFDSNKKHHTREGFKNNYVVLDPKESDDLKYDPDLSLKIVDVSAPLQSDWLKVNRVQDSMTFIGHSTALLQVNGLNILTDPHFSERASPLSFVGPKRLRPPAAQIEQLPHIDVILISHNHYDHLDLPSLRRLLTHQVKQPLLLVPLGHNTLLEEIGATNVRELDWWDHHDVSGTRFYGVPVHHWSARTLWDTDKALWSGWVIESKKSRVFFAGDTAYSPDFQDIAKRFPHFDLSLIPIGAYAPRSVMKSRHVNPAEAVQIHLDLRSRKSMAIHWGSFLLTDEPVGQPLVDLKSALAKSQVSEDSFFIPAHGATYIFSQDSK